MPRDNRTRNTLLGGAAGAATGQTVYAAGNAGLGAYAARVLGMSGAEQAKTAGRGFAYSFSPLHQYRGFKMITGSGPTKARIAGGAAVIAPSIIGGATGAAIGSARRSKVKKADDTKELKRYVNEQKYREAKGERLAAGLTGALLHPLPLAGIIPAIKARPGRKAAVGGRVSGRSVGEGLLAATPGIAMTVVGSKTGSPGLVRAGMLTGKAGSVGGAFHGASAATRNAQLRGDIKKGYSMTTSAFGVDHGEEISKLSFKPVTAGFKAMKFGNAPSVPKVAGRSYKAGIARGQSKLNAGIQGAASAIRHSPGTAMATAGVGTAAVGGTGYAFGRRKD